MGRILSDITKREFILEGIEQVKRIELINNKEDILNIEILSEDIYKVTLIKRVGSFYGR